MQTQIHIKVALDDEFRRFALQPPYTYEKLYLTLTDLFSIQDFKIKFQDDENDWVLLSSDEELRYAVELAGSPLRLQVKAGSETKSASSCSATPSSTVAPASGTEQKEAASEQAEPRRWGRGRGRGGCRGGRGAKAERTNLTKEERLNTKSSRLTERIASLETKLNSGQLNSERDRVLRWRLQKLKSKLEFIHATKQSLQEAIANGVDVNSPDFHGPHGHGHGPHGHGHGGRGGCHGKVSPEIWANFWDRKRDLELARASGNPEEIQVAEAAFKEAKQKKWEAIQAARGGQAGDSQTAQCCPAETEHTTQ